MMVRRKQLELHLLVKTASRLTRQACQESLLRPVRNAAALTR